MCFACCAYVHYVHAWYIQRSKEGIGPRSSYQWLWATVLSFLCIWFYLIPILTSWGRCYYFHFRNGETEHGSVIMTTQCLSVRDLGLKTQAHWLPLLLCLNNESGSKVNTQSRNCKALWSCWRLTTNLPLRFLADKAEKGKWSMTWFTVLRR